VSISSGTESGIPNSESQLEVEVGFDFKPDDKQTVLSGDGEHSLELLLGADDGDTSRWRLRFDHYPNRDAQSMEQIQALIRNVRLETL
jgi:hypothetical protein